MLNTAAERIGGRFAGRPLVEASIRETIGRTYSALNDHGRTAEQLEAAHKLRAQFGGTDDPAVLLGRVYLASAYHNLGKFAESAAEYAIWMENLRRVADTVRARTGFSSVMVELVRDDAAEKVRKEAVQRVRDLVLLQREATGKDVAVVPVLVASGSMTRDKLPRDLAGLPIVYRGDALLADTELARWVEARIHQARSADVSSTDRAFGSAP